MKRLIQMLFLAVMAALLFPACSATSGLCPSVAKYLKKDSPSGSSSKHALQKKKRNYRYKNKNKNVLAQKKAAKKAKSKKDKDTPFSTYSTPPVRKSGSGNQLFPGDMKRKLNLPKD